MRYWWVNQNQTYRHEVAGGYLWSPKRKSNGQVNPFYEFMREVAPGDVVLSFKDTQICAIGIARSHCYECPKPAEFGAAGVNWSNVGWKVDVHFTEIQSRIRPSEHMSVLGSLLPERYSPLLPDGRGSQSVYLTEIPDTLFRALSHLIGAEANHAMEFGRNVAREIDQLPEPALDVAVWEEHLQEGVRRDTTITETEKQAIVLARRGQGLFRQRVSRIERRCRVTGVSNSEHLRASHCKPWRDCASNDERLDGENGLMLTPSIDHLFDRGFISFETSGRLLVSPVADRHSLERMGVKTSERVDVGAFSQRQRLFLEYHQESVFLLRHHT